MGNNDLTNFALTKRFYYFLFLSPPPNKSVYYTPFKVSAQSPAYLFEASLLFSSISDTLLSSMTFSPLLLHHLFPSSLSSTHPFFLLSLSSVVFRLFTEERGWKRLNQAILVGQGVDYHSLISLVTWKCPRLVHIGKKTPSPVDMDKPSNDFMEIDSDEMMSTREETTEDAMTLNNCNGDEHAFVAIFHPSFHLTKQTRRLCNFATMSKRQETSEKTTLNSCNGDVHPLGVIFHPPFPLTEETIRLCNFAVLSLSLHAVSFAPFHLSLSFSVWFSVSMARRDQLQNGIVH
ncbi:hypothetical protein AMTRI_Chr12g270110 [Amborella trichopoda]